jgi:hypothetical protein
LRGLIEGHEELKAKGGKHGVLTGTSNVCRPCSLDLLGADKKVCLALKYGLKPIGTIAHEWIMAVGATYGYKGVNSKAMDLWEEGKLLLAREIAKASLPRFSNITTINNVDRYIHRPNLLQRFHK